MKSKIAIPIALVLLVLGFYGISKSRPKQKPVLTQTSLQADTGVPVEVAAIKTGTVNDSLGVTGQLAAESVTNLSTKVAGKVLTVAVREGDAVRAGQTVIQLDDSDARRQLAQAQAAVLTAQAGVQSAKAKLAQARTTASSSDIQMAAAVASARSGLRSAQANLQQLRTGGREQERAQAANAVAIQKANLTKAQSDYDRYKQLFDEGAIAAAQLEQYSTQLSIAKANYNSSVQSQSITNSGARSEQLQQGEATVQQAQDQLRTALANQQANINKQEDVRAAIAGVAQANATLANSQAGVGIAQQNVANFRIEAPRNGSVTVRNVEPGQYANPGNSLLTIVDLSTIYLQAAISETDVARVQPGMAVDLKVDALGDRIFGGRVQSIIASADPSSRSFIGKIVVDNRDRSLRPNMFARAAIVTGRVVNAMLVPKEAVINRDGKDAVARVVDGKAEFVDVNKGITSGDRIVVRSADLHKQDRIIVSGQDTLQPGQVVKVI